MEDGALGIAVGLMAFAGIISCLFLFATLLKDNNVGVKVEFANDAHQTATLVGWTVAETKAVMMQWDRWRLWNHKTIRCRLNGTFLDERVLHDTILTHGDVLEFAVILHSSGIPSGYVEATFQRMVDGSYAQTSTTGPR